MLGETSKKIERSQIRKHFKALGEKTEQTGQGSRREEIIKKSVKINETETSKNAKNR